MIQLRISINSTFSYIKFNLNYGSVLQCYALQVYLKEHGHMPEHVQDYRVNPINILKRLKNIRYFRCFCRKAKAQFQVQNFIKKYINLSERKYFSYKKLVKKCPDAECHITGSDQVWRGSKNFRYLTYVPDEKIKLSYAASFGKQKLSSEMEQTIRPYLKSFNGISVREKSGVDIINNIGYDAEQVLDPTLLIDWTKYPYRENEKKNYCFCYFLNLASIDNIPYDIIKEIAKKDNKELIITAPLNYPMFMDTARVEFPSIEDWLGYYKNADYIFTNTYHGLLFCIIFKKQFVVFVQGNSTENERFYSLLDLLELSDRIINIKEKDQIREKIYEEINYDKVYKIINNKRKITDNFFSKYGI